VVVEDEVAIADAVPARPRREGLEVEVAGDGPSAVALVERVRPDLVVLDVLLPGFDGLAAGLARGGSLLDLTFPGLAGRLALTATHGLITPAFLVRPSPGW